MGPMKEPPKPVQSNGSFYTTQAWFGAPVLDDEDRPQRHSQSRAEGERQATRG